MIPPFDLEQMEEKIELLIQKDALRKKFAQQAEKSRQKFALDKVVAQWERLLEEIDIKRDLHICLTFCTFSIDFT